MSKVYHQIQLKSVNKTNKNPTRKLSRIISKIPQNRPRKLRNKKRKLRRVQRIKNKVLTKIPLKG